MGILSHALLGNGELLTATINKYGDQVVSGGTSVPCRFRYITGIVKGQNSEANTTFDAIVWFEPEAGVNEGDIVTINSLYWRIERLVRATRLNDNTVLFIKAYVNKHDAVLS
jgi:hypothetical protein